MSPQQWGYIREYDVTDQGIASTEDGISDMYRLPVGIRTVDMYVDMYLCFFMRNIHLYMKNVIFLRILNASIMSG